MSKDIVDDWINQNTTGKSRTSQTFLNWYWGLKLFSVNYYISSKLETFEKEIKEIDLHIMQSGTEWGEA